MCSERLQPLSYADVDTGSSFYSRDIEVAFAEQDIPCISLTRMMRFHSTRAMMLYAVLRTAERNVDVVTIL